MLSIPIQEFDLGLTLRSGQFFRFHQAQGAFIITTHGRLFQAVQEKSRLLVDGVDEAFAREFFGLDDDLTAVRRSLGRDPVLRAALRRVPGLRLLRQEPWECTLAFICSAWSNIPRITQNLEALACLFGRPLVHDGVTGHALPRPGELADARRLRRVRLGYRARYVLAASGTVRSAWLHSLRRLPIEDARRAVRSIPGVGVKIAECILLFSLGFGEAFPVDVWIRRVMRGRYFGGRAVADPAIQAFAAERFGPYAGYAQQVLYVVGRMEGGRARS